jgi:hypothetical protein
MIPKGGMFDISSLAALAEDTTSSGWLVLATALSGSDTGLVFETSGDTPTKKILPLAGAGGFTVRSASNANSLSAGSWRLLVDPESAFDHGSGDPAAGHAFISAGAIGFIGNVRMGGTIYVTTAGKVLSQPNWDSGFMAFRKWRVELVPPTPEQDPLTVAERI